MARLGVKSSSAQRNLRLLISYDGTDYHGWQTQPSLPTVQACIEQTVAQITGNRVKLFGSGRTDAGVHALGQVANFTTACPIPCGNLLKALNDLLPPAVRVRRVEEVRADFHARYAVRSKTYRYRILQAGICSPFLWRFVWHHPRALDRRRMSEAAAALVGEHDFTSFAAAGSAEDDVAPGGEPRSMVRTLSASRILWRERTKILAYEVRGSGFLHHMVRNLVGTLVEVGRGRMAPGDVARILEAQNRTLAGPTAPAQGLCLVRVEY
ncbi:MAG TPA: tRNA pseudouridine(38-40) synthase TruA [Terriglobia bacterium]|nr:tRNA pseudouridine(38-40) synthase TruA [Terriglobia bacterium]